MQRGQWRSQGSAAAVAAALIISFVAVAAADALGESFERAFKPASCLACNTTSYRHTELFRNAAVHEWQTSDGNERSDRPPCTELRCNVSLAH